MDRRSLADAPGDVLTRRAQVFSIMAAGGASIARAAEAALTGSDSDVKAFPNRQRAQDDDRVRVGRIMNTGSPEAVQEALTGTIQDVRDFPRDRVPGSADQGGQHGGGGVVADCQAAASPDVVGQRTAEEPACAGQPVGGAVDQPEARRGCR